jgi:NADPH-dependent 2,4-dienoyl-CoA reductase/sulfur reductase-like enzyme
MTDRLVVIGGDAAGMTAASTVRRARPDAEIVVLEKGGRTSYAACGIPYLVAGEVADVEDLVARSPEEFREKGIDVRLGATATAIDLNARTVEARDEGGASTVIGFDQLMIGTGARPMVPDWPGVDLPHVSVAHTLPDASRLDALATGATGGEAVIVGGGYIGLEMAEALMARGIHVTILDIAPQLLRNIDAEMADRVLAAATRQGVEVLLERNITAVTPTHVQTEEGDIPADVVVLALGVIPNGELAAAAGIATGIRGAISVDDHQRTSADGVFAAGDCCESWHRVTGRPTWIALGTVANKAARVAGVNLSGGDASYGGVLGTAITRLGDTEIARTGLTAIEAADAGLDAVATDIEALTRARYLAEAGPIAVRLVHERGTGRLLGGQIVGGEGAGKRIDTIATALWAGMSVADMVDLDLAYAPPFSPVWDPVNTAARQAVR